MTISFTHVNMKMDGKKGKLLGERIDVENITGERDFIKFRYGKLRGKSKNHFGDVICSLH